MSDPEGFKVRLNPQLLLHGWGTVPPCSGVSVEHAAIGAPDGRPLVTPNVETATTASKKTSKVPIFILCKFYVLQRYF